jgi:hypothetical protein
VLARPQRLSRRRSSRLGRWPVPVSAHLRRDSARLVDDLDALPTAPSRRRPGRRRWCLVRGLAEVPGFKISMGAGRDAGATPAIGWASGTATGNSPLPEGGRHSAVTPQAIVWVAQCSKASTHRARSPR